MPVRFSCYASLFYQSLLADLPPSAWRKMPLIIAILVYNGSEPWHVATDLGSLIGDLDSSAKLSLEEVETMLAESIDRWNRQIREEGREVGREEGRQEGEAQVVLRQLRLKFGPLAPAVEERVRFADTGRLLEWSERVLTAQSLQDIFED